LAPLVSAVMSGWRVWYTTSENMIANAVKDAGRAIGRNPDRLTLPERLALAGKCVALEIYSPETIPLRRIEAIGDSMTECLRTLRSRGLDPRQFEFTRLPRPY
jgi:hypothetical protein